MTESHSAGADLSRLRIDRDAPKPGSQSGGWRSSLVMLVPILVIGGAVYFIVTNRPKEIKVTTVAAAVTAGGAATSVTANGYVVARTKASVSAKAAGRLVYLGVSEGSHVPKGQVIARLDNADFLAAMAQADANVASMEASLLEAASDRDQLVRDVNRLRDMRAQNSALISSQELELAVSRAAQAEARVKVADARKRVAESGLRLAQANNENTVIRAPFTGTVLRKDAEVGEVVAPSMGGGGLTRGAVVTMADLSTLEVEVDVNEAYIARVTSGLRARITLDAYPDTAFRGAVRQVVPTADRQRATVQVKVSITDHDPRILPEMGAKVDFLQPDSAVNSSAPPVSRTVFRVPAEAVREEAGQSVVWVVREDKLARRIITAGPVSAGFREVRVGLSGGEQLLLSGVDLPTEGMRVKVK